MAELHSTFSTENKQKTKSDSTLLPYMSLLLLYTCPLTPKICTNPQVTQYEIQNPKIRAQKKKHKHNSARLLEHVTRVAYILIPPSQKRVNAENQKHKCNHSQTSGFLSKKKEEEKGQKRRTSLEARESRRSWRC